VQLRSEGAPPVSVLPEAVDWAIYQFWSDPTSAAEMREFVNSARDRDVLFDVGAHFGIFSTVHALVNRGGLSFAYEPTGAAARIAREHFVRNGVSDRVELVEAAIGQVLGFSSAVVDPAGFARFGGEIAGPSSAFEMRTLDSEIERIRRRPDLLKIDVEGFELEVLRGGSRLLREGHPLVFLELHLDAIEKKGGEPREVIEELTDAGYSEFRIGGRPVGADRICEATTSLVRLTAR
jgi:FkbM family methyltransferase